MKQRRGGVHYQGRCLYLITLALASFPAQLSLALTARRPFKHTIHQSTSNLHARWQRSGDIYPENDGNGMQKEKQVQRPTMTEVETQRPSTTPGKPKIVVLGASGKIGRLVVQQLMEMPNLDATIVAFVRDYDKACRVFYDDVLVPRTQSRRGPQLQIVVGNLVPPEDLPGFVDQEEVFWEETAKSASRFYKTKLRDYDNRELLPDTNESLEDAIKGCTTVISCVGAVRPTNIWTDYIQIPVWRLFRKDVSGWCRDERHPYYIHYLSTKKALAIAESEQRRRDTAVEDQGKDGDETPAADRIRFIRISDLCLSKEAWSFIPVVTNVIQSMVFRYQDMTERLLEQSTAVDTVILRPGDLTDEERDENTTSLQVDPSGKLPYPAMVSREDVASLAVSSALFQALAATNTTTDKKAPPFHMTLAMRWVGECTEHQPNQGDKNLGLKDAESCMEKILKGNRKNVKRNRRRQLKTMQAYHPTLIRFMEKRKRSLKPYAIFAAIPVYFVLGLGLSTLMQYLPLHRIPGYDRAVLFIVQLQRAIIAAMMLKLPQIRQWVQSMGRRKSYISF